MQVTGSGRPRLPLTPRRCGHDRRARESPAEVIVSKVPCGRAHPDDAAEIVVTELEPGCDLVPAHEFEIACKAPVKAGPLHFVDAEQAQRRYHLTQVIRRRRDDEQCAVRMQDARELAAVARCEYVENEGRHAARDGQPAPRIADRRADSAVGSSRAPGRVLGAVEREPTPAGRTVEHRGEPVAGSGACVDDERGRRRRDELGGRLRDRVHDLVVVAGGEELGARGDHGAGIGRCRGPAGVQVDVALPRDVEAVAVRASQRAVEV